MSDPVDLQRLRRLRDLDRMIPLIEQMQDDLALLLDALEGAPPERVRLASRKIGATAQQANGLALATVLTLRAFLDQDDV